MKIAVMADIHSNVFALEKVLADIKSQHVDLILNLGDILYGPIAPKETYQLLAAEDIITIRGNQDRQIYEASETCIKLHPTMEFILDDLGSEPVNWLRSLPFDKRIEDVYLFHGSPKNDLEYLLENIDHGFPLVRSDEEITKLLYGERANMVLCGHTHIFRSVMLDSGQIVVNPGSVGLQAYKDDEPVIHAMENYSPYASYAIIEKAGDTWSISHKQIPYDFIKASEEAAKRNRNDWAFSLRTGRAK